MTKLTHVVDKQGEFYTFYCQGCEMTHTIPVRYNPGFEKLGLKSKPTWRFNGNLEKPTFQPSFKIEWKGTEPLQVCLSIIRDGEIIFLIESTHKHSGARMKLRDAVTWERNFDC